MFKLTSQHSDNNCAVDLIELKRSDRHLSRQSKHLVGSQFGSPRLNRLVSLVCLFFCCCSNSSSLRVSATASMSRAQAQETVYTFTTAGNGFDSPRSYPQKTLRVYNVTRTCPPSPGHNIADLGKQCQSPVRSLGDNHVSDARRLTGRISDRIARHLPAGVAGSVNDECPHCYISPPALHECHRVRAARIIRMSSRLWISPTSSTLSLIDPHHLGGKVASDASNHSHIASSEGCLRVGLRRMRVPSRLRTSGGST